MQFHKRHYCTVLACSIFFHGGAFAYISLVEPTNDNIIHHELNIKLTAVSEHHEVKNLSAPKPVSIPLESIETPKLEKAVVKADSPKPKLVRKQTVPSNTPALEENSIVESEVQPAVVDSKTIANYEQIILSWLDKHKRYPRTAQRRNIEGNALIQVRLSRSGQVEYSRIVQSSNSVVLDQAIVEMLQRANPFPPAPENFPTQRLEFVVPIAFQLK